MKTMTYSPPMFGSLKPTNILAMTPHRMPQFPMLAAQTVRKSRAVGMTELTAAKFRATHAEGGYKPDFGELIRRLERELFGATAVPTSSLLER